MNLALALVGATGQTQQPYLGRWLLLTAAMFGASAEKPADVVRAHAGQPGDIIVSMGDVLYEDATLLLDEDGVTIRRYYFPLAWPKRIPYAAIRHVYARPLSWVAGKGRGWGTAHFGYWLSLDLRRWRKVTLLVLEVGTRVKPCVSPDDPQRVIELLRNRVPID